MKQSKYIILLLLCCLFCSCAGQSSPYVLDVPDKVEVVKTDKHIRIKGTCIFIVPPEGFAQSPLQSVLINRDGVFIRFVEGVDRNVDNMINFFLKEVPEVYTYGKTGYWKIFEMNKDKGFVTHTFWNSERSNLSLILGNTSYMIGVGCEYPADDLLLRDALLESMLTAYIDTTYRAESMKELAFFTVDLSGTDFKQGYYGGNIYYYTINGVDPAPGSDIDVVITIKLLPYAKPEDHMKGAIAKDTVFHVLQTLSTEVNDYPAVECYSEGVVSGAKSDEYSVVFGNGRTSIHFVGIVYQHDKYEEYLAEFKRIVQTIRFKAINETK